MQFLVAVLDKDNGRRGYYEFLGTLGLRNVGVKVNFHLCFQVRD
jgi:hypothetical protein